MKQGARSPFSIYQTAHSNLTHKDLGVSYQFMVQQLLGAALVGTLNQQTPLFLVGFKA